MDTPLFIEARVALLAVGLTAMLAWAHGRSVARLWSVARILALVGLLTLPIGGPPLLLDFSGLCDEGWNIALPSFWMATAGGAAVMTVLRPAGAWTGVRVTAGAAVAWWLLRDGLSSWMT